MVSEKVWHVLTEGSSKYGVFGHGFTYSAHPIGAATAMANLDIIDNDRLIEVAAQQGAYMHERLQANFADHPLVGEIRGFGLIGAIELVARRDPPVAFDPKLTVAGRVARAALSMGVITRALPNADTLAFSPPFIISKQDIDTLVDTVANALDRVQDELVKEGSWRA